LMRSGAHCIMLHQPFTPHMTERVRLTITVTPEVHEVFSRMADASGVSLGRTMGDWLADTIDGAQFVAQKMVEAKAQPAVLMREMQAMARGLLVETNSVAELVRRSGHGAVAPSPAVARPSPPASNTGGKVPRANPQKRGEPRP